MNEELLKEVLGDGEFSASLMEMESEEQVQAALKEKGVEISTQDILNIKKALSSQKDGELSEDELEDVAGGSLTIGAAIGIATIIATSVSGAIKLGDKVDTWSSRRW